MSSSKVAKKKAREKKVRRITNMQRNNSYKHRSAAGKLGKVNIG